MRTLIISIFFVSSIYAAGMDSVISEISQLKADYAACVEKFSVDNDVVIIDDTKYLEDEIETLKKEIISKDEEILLLERKNKSLRTELSKSIQKSKKVVINKKSEIFDPSSFRINVDSPIYDKPNSKVIEHWQSGRSFTSNERKNGFIKITGYFVNKQWKSAKKSMWVSATSCSKR
ncbi:MAG: hypothetical protein GQ570_09880 [Helicobacteraceae bacterium]|nr:hypothetical protein [Helicobacteraceae bacterium]